MQEETHTPPTADEHCSLLHSAPPAHGCPSILAHTPPVPGAYPGGHVHTFESCHTWLAGQVHELAPGPAVEEAPPHFVHGLAPVVL